MLRAVCLLCYSAALVLVAADGPTLFYTGFGVGLNLSFLISEATFENLCLIGGTALAALLYAGPRKHFFASIFVAILLALPLQCALSTWAKDFGHYPPNPLAFFEAVANPTIELVFAAIFTAGLVWGVGFLKDVIMRDLRKSRTSTG